MVDSAPPASGSEDAPVSGQASLLELRELLFGPDRESLHQIERQFFDPHLHAQRVSRVLPEAISIRASQDDELIPALQSTVEEIIRVSVQRRPGILVSALFPIIGSAIRRSIANAFRDMMQSLTRTLDASLSPRSLKWRWEAFRTGKTFAEVVLLHTMYRVEQVFLIHRANGLLLDHVVADAVASQDPDLVSAMLTAIRDFVKDSFKTASSAEAELEKLEVGDLTIWVEQGPNAILAAVIRGSAPSEYRETLQETIEKIHLDQGADLENFQGDSSVFSRSRPLLADCLRMQFEGEKPSKGGISPLLWALPVVLFLLVAVWIFFSWQQSRRWAGFLDRLDSEPGIVVAQAGRRAGKYQVSGLRDPLSRDPGELFREAGFNTQDLEARWEPYIALAPELVQARAEALLQPPATVSLRVRDGVLTAEGSAPPDWIARSRQLASSLPGVSSLDLSALQDSLQLRILELQKEIEATRFFFEPESSQLGPDQGPALSRLADRVRSLRDLASGSGREVQLLISGHVDGTGPPALNESLKVNRARSIVRALSDAGLSSSSEFEILVASPQQTGGLDRLDRSVSFQVRLREGPKRQLR